jgi:hypothetical protein
VLREVVDDDNHGNILLLPLPALPQHAMALCQRQGDCHHALFLPCTSLPYAPGGEGGELIITNNIYLRGDDIVNNVRPRPSDTHKSTVGKEGGGGGNNDDKEEDCDGWWMMTGKAAVALT